MHDKLIEEDIKKTLKHGALAGAAAASTALATNKSDEQPIQKQDIVQKSDNNKSDISSKVKERIMLNVAKQYIGKHEGARKEIYKDSKGKDTIGIGHLIKPGEDFSDGIDDAEIQKLFDKDIQERLAVTKDLFDDFDSYPPYVQVTLLDGVYRGDLSGSPKTIKLINTGEWTKASEEYLDNREYRASVASEKAGTPHGIWKRMAENAKRMKHYGEQILKDKN